MMMAVDAPIRRSQIDKTRHHRHGQRAYANGRSSTSTLYRLPVSFCHLFRLSPTAIAVLFMTLLAVLGGEKARVGGQIVDNPLWPPPFAADDSFASFQEGNMTDIPTPGFRSYLGQSCFSMADCPQAMDCAFGKCACRLWYQLGGPDCTERTSGTLFTGISTLVVAIPWFLFNLRVCRYFIQYLTDKKTKSFNAKGAILVTIYLCSLSHWINDLAHAYLSLSNTDIKILFQIHDGPRAVLDGLIGTFFMLSELIIVAVWIELASTSSVLSKHRVGNLKRSRVYIIIFASIFMVIYIYAHVIRQATLKTIATTFFGLLTVFLFHWGGNRLASILEELDSILTTGGMPLGAAQGLPPTRKTTMVPEVTESATSGAGTSTRTGTGASTRISTGASINASTDMSTGAGTGASNAPTVRVGVPGPRLSLLKGANTTGARLFSVTPMVSSRFSISFSSSKKTPKFPLVIEKSPSRGERLRTLAKRANFTIMGTLIGSGGYSYARYWVGDGILSVACVHVSYLFLFVNLNVLVNYVMINNAANSPQNSPGAHRMSRGSVAPATGMVMITSSDCGALSSPSSKHAAKGKGGDSSQSLLGTPSPTKTQTSTTTESTGTTGRASRADSHGSLSGGAVTLRGDTTHGTSSSARQANQSLNSTNSGATTMTTSSLIRNQQIEASEERLR